MPWLRELENAHVSTSNFKNCKLCGLRNIYANYVIYADEVKSSMSRDLN